MRTVTLQWSNRRTREALLEDIPRVGELILPSAENPGSADTLIVEQVTYTEGRIGRNGQQSDPQVIVSVRPRDLSD